MTIQVQYVDIEGKKIFPAYVTVTADTITSVTPAPFAEALPYLIPGFIDAHVHIESSMLIPSEFARLAVVHGTVATVSDPHEIANVCGEEGVRYMISNGKRVPFKFHFGAPSCVPATVFETAGASMDAKAVAALLQDPDIYYLTEMMNFPGVLHQDAEVMAKIKAANTAGKKIDGHAPGLRGEQARKYIEAGISTDHECFTAAEALEKLQYGMKIIIREGSAAKNFDALIHLLHQYEDDIMFCSDDKHPDSLVAGHINQLCERAIAKGIDVFKVLKAACVNPVVHYGLPVGLLRVGDPADMVLVKDLKRFEVVQTYVNGRLVAENGRSFLPEVEGSVINKFEARVTSTGDFLLSPTAQNELPVMVALDGQLITEKEYVAVSALPDHFFNAKSPIDIASGYNLLAVVNRYQPAPPAVALIKHMNIKEGAIASSVAHDSHNIVVVGADAVSMSRAVNLIMEQQGGISAVHKAGQMVLSLPVAGLMSTANGYEVAAAYTAMDAMAKQMGSTLAAPFMTLSFMALLVIPHLKLSDKGLFDGDAFCLMH